MFLIKTRLVPSGTFPPAAVTITRQLPKKKMKKKDEKKKKTPWGPTPPQKNNKQAMVYMDPPMDEDG